MFDFLTFSLEDALVGVYCMNEILAGIIDSRTKSVYLSGLSNFTTRGHFFLFMGGSSKASKSVMLNRSTNTDGD